MTASALVAMNRFGLGATPTDLPPERPQAWLIDQLARFDPRPPALAGLPSTGAVLEGLLARREAIRAAKRAGDAEAATSAEKAKRAYLNDAYNAATAARIAAALATETPFAERLVHFWSNHFAVSADKDETRGLAGAFEFEAIRSNLGKSFSDMLLAVETHPAMLLYLDQAQSVGPDSPAATLAAGRRTLGLNENLAREAMELHTMGVRSGYTQADVTELARALTGWSVQGAGRGLPARLRETGSAPSGTTVFRAAFHQPGARTVLGRRYADTGARTAPTILADLAARPETATHIAVKLARHFIADDPPPAAVARLAAVFTATHGDLPALHRALVETPEAWSAAPKFKSPWEWSVSALRALGLTAPGPDLAANRGKRAGVIAELGQPIWRPGSPAGWADGAAAWAGPDALVRRVEVAERLAGLAPPTLDARALAPRLLGPLAPMTARMIAAADSPRQALALLLASPEFQRR